MDDAPAALHASDVMVMPRGFIADLPSAELFRDRWVAVCGTTTR